MAPYPDNDKTPKAPDKSEKAKVDGGRTQDARTQGVLDAVNETNTKVRNEKRLPIIS